MTDSTLRGDLEGALGDDYDIGKETPNTVAGFSVFIARSRSDGSSVEIKAVPADVFASAAPVSEADLSARRVQHPNIVPIIETGRHAGVFYWMSPALEARTLRARLTRGGRMTLRDSLTVLRDVSAALTHAHLHGVVHGGLSPDSVIISGGSALITDLGVSEVFAGLRRRSTRTEAAVSSAADPLRYASPEEANGGKSDARSDVYAWGVIGYELLSGRHPFAGRNTPRQMMAAHIEEEPVQLTSGPSAAPSAVTRLVMRCLSKDPSKRPESAREILAVLTKEMLVPPPQPAAGSGQKAVLAMFVLAVVLIVAIAWMGMRP
jgi:serine/threonine-protein kinase